MPIYDTSDDVLITGTNGADEIHGYPETNPPSYELPGGLYRPLFATAPKDVQGQLKDHLKNHLFVVSQGGKITAHDLANPQAARKNFIEIPISQIGNADEAGLLGFTFHPQFATNGKCYVNYTEQESREQVIVEYTIDLNDTRSPPASTSRKIMAIDYPDDTTHHRAGWIDFGPDGMLYIATGDGWRIEGTRDSNANAAQTLVNPDLYAVTYGDAFTETGKVYRLSGGTPVTDGPDSVEAGAGDDTVYGGSGDDTIHGGDDNDLLYGEADNDIIYGDAGADTLKGGSGGDTLDGGNGADTLEGGAGSDFYYIDGSDTVVESEADAGEDWVFTSGSFVLGDGQDVESLVAESLPDGVDLDINLTGNALGQNLFGNAGKNVLIGGGGADTLKGLDGDDTYEIDSDDTVSETNALGGATSGNDTVKTAFSYELVEYVENLILLGTAVEGIGNELANTITGNSAENSLLGAEGADTLIGEGGADTLDGGDGADSLQGGSGADTYIIDNTNDVINETAVGEEDTLFARVSYTLAGAAHVEILKAAGNGVINLTGNGRANTLHGNRANNVLDGGANVDGNDAAVFTGRRADYNVTRKQNGSFRIQDTRANGDGIDTVLNVEIFKFSDGTVTAENLLNKAPTGITPEFDVVAENNETGTSIVTFKVIDADDAQHRFELLDNADGRFAIDPSTGTLKVADGVRLDYEQATQHSITVRATDGAGASFTKTLVITVDNVLNETATGDALGNLILGGNGQDTFSGGAGNDTINAGAGNDRLNGDAGNDSLVGGAGNDVFSGGDGNDRLVGGLGKDTFTGGKGRDVFVFDDRDTGSSKTTADTILDFKGREGDRLDLRAVDANTKKSGDQNFSFIGRKAFSKAGEVRYEKAKGYTYVHLNTDSDKAAEAVIKLKGSIDLSKAWFVL